MVVTRRQSVAPLPAVASRTNSSFGLSRSMKGKGVDKPSSLKEPGASPIRTPPNDTPSRDPPLGPQVPGEALFDDQEVLSAAPKPPLPKPSIPGPKSKSKSKQSIKTRKRHLNKGISIFDILGRLVLLWFTIYTLSVCPEDVELRSPVCRALTEYRRLVLEPYVYPPIRNALDHPSVAPHLRRAQPYYNRAIQTTMPWVRRGKHEWRTRVVPRVQWCQLRARPYFRRLEREYEATLGPYVRQASEVVAECKVKAEPYILSATLKTRRKWRRARPYVLPLWRGALHVPGFLARVVGKPLGDARKQWVDPQLAKIWAAVVEKGQADTMNVKTVPTTSTSRSSSASSRATSSSSASVPTVSGSTSSSAEASSSTSTLYTPTTLKSDSSSQTAVSLEDIPTSSNAGASVSHPLVPEPTDDASPSASSIVMDRVSPTSSSKLTISTESMDGILTPGSSPLVDTSVPQSTDQVAISASSVQETQLQPSRSSVTPSSTSSQISSQPSFVEEEVDDLEGFLSEIGLNDDPKSDEPPPPAPVSDESEEEEQEHLRRKSIETAEKRAEIEGRHSQWEIDLEKFGKAQRKLVRATLNRLREAAVEEARAPGAAIRMHVEGLLQEAEKSLRALKAYTKKLAAENKSDGEKIKTWEIVVNKVDKKFGERVEAAADAVREWWSTYVNKEIAEILAIGEEVTEMAHRAQADIGLDYSWLADVSYDDWQRYHKLVDTSKKFADIYLAMQNGTHKTSPPNPLIDIMEALQEEVDDMVLGFEANLTRVKYLALDRFSGIETKTDGPKVTPETGPEVSILPIDPITAEGTDGPIPPVILSRGPEEIKAAVSRAEEAKTKTPHEEL